MRDNHRYKSAFAFARSTALRTRTKESDFDNFALEGCSCMEILLQNEKENAPTNFLLSLQNLLIAMKKTETIYMAHTAYLLGASYTKDQSLELANIYFQQADELYDIIHADKPRLLREARGKIALQRTYIEQLPPPQKPEV